MVAFLRLMPTKRAQNLDILISFDGDVTNTVAIHPNECITLLFVEGDTIKMKVEDHLLLV